MVPLEHPSSTPRVPPDPRSTASSTPVTKSGLRTSVVAHPHVVVVGVAAVAAVAADDVDGAGAVDHRRVVRSRSPSRVGRAARPRDTCGRNARDNRPVAPNATTRAAATRGAGRAIDTASRRRATRGRAQRRGAHTREIAIRWNRTNPYMRSQRHAYTHAHARARARAQKWTQTHT
jgi:hypothetical protein